MNRIIAVLALAVALSACSSGLKKEDDPGPSPATIVVNQDATEGSADQLYLRAKALLDRQQYETALSNFENLEATHPFGEHAAQARLDIAYAYYKLGEHQSAIAAANRFLKLYPQHQKADYAYYLKGLSNFTKSRTLFEGIVPRKLHLLDQSALRLSLNDFATMVNRFPNSDYVADSQKRMNTIREAMALHELSTAEYYFERSAMVAAINRVNAMLEQYPDTSHSVNGLSLLTRAYLALGDRETAASVVRKIEQRDPAHPELKVFRALRDNS